MEKCKDLHIKNQYIIALATAPDATVARNLSHQLVEKKLAACVNLIPNISSIYIWQETVEESDEVLMLIKTSKNHFTAIEQLLKEEHPYEVPELISCTIEQISNSYQQWLAKSTTFTTLS